MKIYSQNSLTENDYIDIGKHLSSSGILIYPTETSYAIGANALDNAAVKMIYDIKGRDFTKPLPVLVKDLNMLINIAYVGRQEEDIISKFWPGPLTILFKSKISGKYLFTSDSEFVGARISPHPFPEMLFNKIDFPITATSANISGEDSLTDFESIKMVSKGFEEKIVLIDGGELTGGASTIIRTLKKKVIMVREGDNNTKERLVCYMKNKKIL
ncbi:MAG: L-threonylcarbamoyladenylate synthase [Deltaproteobacteria bacterium]|nr:L-threonylcarbamoyladenylate synthase [Deltaproteobacteria bacterium]MCL5893187.1 L-threonylcarbamoyladenylate synthase [Deltaproteobacteria bacterium]